MRDDDTAVRGEPDVGWIQCQMKVGPCTTGWFGEEKHTTCALCWCVGICVDDQSQVKVFMVIKQTVTLKWKSVNVFLKTKESGKEMKSEISIFLQFYALLL